MSEKNSEIPGALCDVLPPSSLDARSSTKHQLVAFVAAVAVLPFALNTHCFNGSSFGFLGHGKKGWKKTRFGTLRKHWINMTSDGIMIHAQVPLNVRAVLEEFLIS